MKNRFKKTLQGLLIVPVLALGVSAVAPMASVSAAVDPTVPCDDKVSIGNGINCSKSESQQGTLTGTTGAFTIVTNVLLFIIGAVSVIMLIIGGIRYTVSGGDSGAVTSAKNTILYAIVGIVVALLAYALVNFVVGSFVSTTP